MTMSAVRGGSDRRSSDLIAITLPSAPSPPVVEREVETLSRFVLDREDVREITVEMDERSDTLTYVVRALDRQARVHGKTVEFVGD
jgi:hypothetical protein